jgi:hypothetical protein
MAKGIVNPFFEAPPKVNTQNIPIQQKGATQREAPLPTEAPSSFIDLDGDSYILRFKYAKDVPQIIEHLVELLYTVRSEHEDTLNNNGIYFEEHPQTWTLHDVQNRAFFVAVPEEATELDVYRRLGYALRKLQSKTMPILKKFGIQIIERG